MDGVLVDSSRIHEDAFIRVFESIDDSIKFSYLNYAGQRTEQVIRQVLKSHSIELTADIIKELSLRKTKLASEKLRSSDILYDGISELLKLIKDKNKKIILASSASRKNVDLICEVCGLTEYFDFTLSADDIVNSKPSPEIFQKAIQLLGFESAWAVVIEDSIAGLEAAKAASIDFIAVATSHTEEILKAFSPLICVSKTKDIGRFL